MSMYDNPDVKLQIKDYYPKLAEMNQLYNEMSAAYYIWKNDTDDIKGMVQYRFVPDMTYEQMVETLKVKKYILHALYVSNIKDQFKFYHDNDGDLWDMMFQFAKESGINDTVLDHWSKTNIMFSRNTIITTGDEFDSYMSWVFPILENIKNAKGFTDMNAVRRWAETRKDNHPVDYKMRLFGFLTERLETLWIINRFGNVRNAIDNICVPNFIILTKQLPI